MIRYTYRNVKTGKKVYSDKPLKHPDLVLVRQVRDTRMKSGEAVRKGHVHIS